MAPFWPPKVLQWKKLMNRFVSLDMLTLVRRYCMKLYVLLSYWEDGDGWGHNDTFEEASTDCAKLVAAANERWEDGVSRCDGLRQHYESCVVKGPVTELPDTEPDIGMEREHYDYIILETEIE
jgi:hypothetical protein